MRLQLWLSKMPGLTPVQIDERMERGSYTVFDLGQWGQVLTDFHHSCVDVIACQLVSGSASKPELATGY